MITCRYIIQCKTLHLTESHQNKSTWLVYIQSIWSFFSLMIIYLNRYTFDFIYICISCVLLTQLHPVYEGIESFLSVFYIKIWQCKITKNSLSSWILKIIWGCFKWELIRIFSFFKFTVIYFLRVCFVFFLSEDSNVTTQQNKHCLIINSGTYI